MRTALEVIMDVESELALHGYADPCTSLFRGCHLCFLPLHVPQHHPQHHPQPAIASEAPNAGSQPAAVSAAAESRLFQSTLDAVTIGAATQAALVDCQAKRVALQVTPDVCPARWTPTSSTQDESALHNESVK